MSYDLQYYDQYSHYVKMDLAEVPLFQHMFDKCARLAKGRMLDIGCGVGYLVNWLGTQGWDSVGLDFSTPPLIRGSKIYPLLQFVRGSAYELPFPAERFDVVLAVNIVEHLDRPRELVEQAFMVLKPGGTLVLVTPEVRSLFKKVWIHDSTHVHEFMREEIVALISEFGTVEDVIVTNAVGRLGRRLNYMLARLMPCDILIEARKPNCNG